jgi:hypothetical protein
MFETHWEGRAMWFLCNAKAHANAIPKDNLVKVKSSGEAFTWHFWTNYQIHETKGGTVILYG